ncbi:MAG: choice-of-anchor J domain-containing protein [Bacteroidota bacterium]
MQLRFFFKTLFLGVFPCFLDAQEVIFSENFDSGCSLPPGWSVQIAGNQNAVWYVDDGLRNNDQNGLSMNGSCFLIIDDDAVGNNTPSYSCDVMTAPFDISQYPTISLSADVHYRDHGPSNESFQILLSDENGEHLLRTFAQGNSTGDSLFEFVTAKFDLSFISASANARLVFRYSDGGGFAWWAAIDNIKVTGGGTGVNVLKENFNDCAKPAGWETQILTGDHDWQFGSTPNPKAAGKNLDGTCMAYFDDDLLGDSVPYSAVRLISPWFDGTQFGRFELNFDVTYRYYQDRFAVYVQKSDGSEYPLTEVETDLGGPNFPAYTHLSLDLSAHRDQQMRIIFEYEDGQTWAWWIGIDNVKVTGNGAANDICSSARELYDGVNCQEENTFTALFDGPAPECINKPGPALWYTWKAGFTGKAAFNSGADFNDVVNIYRGDCVQLESVACQDRDEHGFTGETARFQVIEGEQYRIRVCGKEGEFGVSRGKMCVSINQELNVQTVPVNDDCAGAIPLLLNEPCNEALNIHGNTDRIPSLNELARADIWYQITAPDLQPGEILKIKSNADFSDIITLYSGLCNSLSEVAGNHKGGSLSVQQLNAGETYLLQIAGTFATIEGRVCPEIQTVQRDAPVNDLCQNAVEIAVGGDCTQGTNIGATFDGQLPGCVPALSGDVWFSFTAPASGIIRINTGAEFQHIMGVWKGVCGSMNPLACHENPLRCNGYVTVGGLTAGETYYLQIAGQHSAAGISTGEFCVRIADGATQPDYTPIEMLVEERCMDVDVARLDINISGGSPPYMIYGNQDGEMLPAGTAYFTVVEDTGGCQTSFTGVIDACSGSICNLAATLASTDPSCHNSGDGSIIPTVASGTGPYLYLWSDGTTDSALAGASAGVHSVTITDALECELVLSDTLHNPDPVMIAPLNVVQPSQNQQNGVVEIETSGTQGSIQALWIRNGIPLPISGTTNLYNAAAGNYTLIITDEKGCTAQFEITLTETVSASEAADEAYAEVFPNPAHEKATLAVSFTQPRDLYISLTDESGKLISYRTEKQVQEQNIPIDINQLPAGNYQLRIVSKEGHITRQIVKQ